MARNGGRVAPLEQQAQAVGRALALLQLQQARGERFLLGRGGMRFALARADRRELRLEGAALLAQLEERAVRLRERARAFLQLVGGFAAGLLRFGEALLQALDAPAQLVQVLRPGRVARAPRAARGGEQQDRDRARGYLAFPCAATWCIAAATASASPR